MQSPGTVASLQYQLPRMPEGGQPNPKKLKRLVLAWISNASGDSQHFAFSGVSNYLADVIERPFGQVRIDYHDLLFAVSADLDFISRKS